MISRVKTKSIWGHPNSSYFQFLDIIIKRDLPKTLCILGCSDGKFVIHPAKKGFKVFAIDIDKIALYGGKTIDENKPVIVEGLLPRLKHENIDKNVEVVNDDFLSYKSNKTFSGVFTSGSIHYAENSKYSLNHIVKKIGNYVSINGMLFLEYIHRSDADSDPNRHFVTKEQMTSYFNNPGWITIKHTRRTYIENPNPRVPMTHKIVWGKLQLVKIKE